MNKDTSPRLFFSLVEIVFLSLVYLIIAFIVHYRNVFNIKGLVLFSFYLVIMNFILLIFYFYIRNILRKNKWVIFYSFWLIFVLFFLWNLYRLNYINIGFYLDTLVISIAGIIFFRGVEEKKWIAFIFAINTAYFLFASTKSEFIFYILILWLLLTGYRLDKLLVQENKTIKQISISFLLGLGYLIVFYFVMKIIEHSI